MTNSTALETGKIRWYNGRRGFGFIEGKDGKDIFVHWSEIRSIKDYKVLHEGDEVIFKREWRPKGDYAVSVSKLEPVENNLPVMPSNIVSEESEK